MLIDQFHHRLDSLLADVVAAASRVSAVHCVDDVTGDAEFF
ncbi:MAG TPA: hypothetical protein VHI72_17200 [Hyphomicrobiaceae bacterium]|nr:hypothetical protein [Hyphomicrobiaceae bacterium]